MQQAFTSLRTFRFVLMNLTLDLAANRYFLRNITFFTSFLSVVLLSASVIPPLCVANHEILLNHFPLFYSV